MNRNASPATKEEVIGKELARIAKERAKAMEHVGEQVKRTIAFLQENEGKIGGKIYAVSSGENNVGLYYDKAILQKAGFTRGANLPGGMLRWRGEGRQVEGGAV